MTNFAAIDFETAVRLPVSLGGDSDTLACITGGIAEAYYKEIPDEIAREMWSRLPETFREILREMRGRFRCSLGDL
ncbi:MAG: ADP-ribosylglycohydrolase family protein [Bacteroidales bacterium]|nr:ADP-ribosylglycohydrolase family protein [Bacteroidales bacterium]